MHNVGKNDTERMQVLVFTDFDGTILDHYSYSFEAAKPCIDRLTAMGIVIIPNTSKTFAEVLVLQKKMALSTPMIIENGAAIYIPPKFFPKKPRGAIFKDGFWVKSFSQKRQQWQTIVKKLKREYQGEFEAFSDMNNARLMEVTGLDEQSAKYAATREFGEPLLWLSSDDQRDKFIDKAKTLGAYPLLGGRFLHICGNSNKGSALLWFVDEYKRQYGTNNVTSIALGDGKNDIDMLDVADTAVCIKSPVDAPLNLERTTGVFSSMATGPQGLREILDQLIPDNTKDN